MRHYHWHHSGPHGHDHAAHQRHVALIMIGTGLLRVAIWLALIITYLFHVHAVRSLYASVSFVALLSVVALLLTDWGQVAASLAQLTAGDAHHDVEEVRQRQSTSLKRIEEDIGRLAELHPGPEAARLAQEIRQRLVSGL